MDKQIIVKLHSSFEEMAQKDMESGADFWCARDLQMLLGYARWENFLNVIEKAKTSCRTSGYDPEHHFLDATKMVDLGSGAKRQVDDILLRKRPDPLRDRSL